MVNTKGDTMQSYKKEYETQYPIQAHMFPFYENPVIKKTNSSYGNWVIKLSDIQFRFFWTKSQATEWVNQ